MQVARANLRGRIAPTMSEAEQISSLIGDLSKKRGDTMYEARVPSEPDTLKAVVKLLAWNSPIIAS